MLVLIFEVVERVPSNKFQTSLTQKQMTKDES